MTKIRRNKLPYARHYNPRFVYFLPTFWSPKTFFQGAFFVKFWPYVWLVFKSGFKSRAGYNGARTVLYHKCHILKVFPLMNWLNVAFEVLFFIKYLTTNVTFIIYLPIMNWFNMAFIFLSSYILRELIQYVFWSFVLHQILYHKCHIHKVSSPYEQI